MSDRDSKPQNRNAWERALDRLHDEGKDVPAILARAGFSISHWRGRETPFPVEQIMLSEAASKRLGE